MGIVELATGRRLTVAIAPVEHKDFRQITKKNHFFDWKKERGHCWLFVRICWGNSFREIF
jgi:hypothetical protein